jgi:hypothetical protein
MPEYIGNRPDKSSNNLRCRKVGFLADSAPEIAPLFKSALKCFWCAIQLELFTEDVVLDNSMFPRFRDIFNDLVDLCVR